MPILAVHDEIVVECAEKDAEMIEAWLKKAMIDGIEEVLNGHGAEGARVPVEVEVEILKTWAA